MTNLFKKSMQIGCVTGLLLSGFMTNANAMDKEIDKEKYINLCRQEVELKLDYVNVDFSILGTSVNREYERIIVNLSNTKFQNAFGVWKEHIITCKYNLADWLMSFSYFSRGEGWKSIDVPKPKSPLQITNQNNQKYIDLCYAESEKRIDNGELNKNIFVLSKAKPHVTPENNKVFVILMTPNLGFSIKCQYNSDNEKLLNFDSTID